MADKPKVRNFAQQRGETQARPLLPLEYCSIERAARLLGCEEYDLFHFERIGAIEMCVELNRHRGTISFISENVSNNKSLPGEYRFGEQSSLYNTNGCAYLSGFWTVSVGDIRGEVHEVDVLGKNGDTTIYEEYGGNITTNINEAIKVDDVEGHVMTNIHLDVMPYVNRKIGELIVCDAAAGITINYSGVISLERFCASRLVIMRPDLERLYDSITNGTPLSNRYNDEAKRIAAEEREKMVVHQERETTGPFNLIELLLKLNPETSDVQYQPTTCFNVIESLCAKAQIENTIPKSTFESWIRKINSSKK